MSQTRTSPRTGNSLAIFLYTFAIFGIFLLLFYTLSFQNVFRQPEIIKYNNVIGQLLPSVKFALHPDEHKKSDYNVWLIFTKVGKESPLRYKFSTIIRNLVNVSSVPLKFNVIVDEISRELALNEFKQIESNNNGTSWNLEYYFYDLSNVAALIQDIVNIMTPHFSSKPGTYYSGALFYISLGLHRIAPESQGQVILLDCDLYFKQDILLLFEEFSRFKSTALFGLAPELTPVYRHILHKYKTNHKTTFGEFYHKTNVSSMVNGSHPKGFQGYNSGVVLLDLKKIRESLTYNKKLLNYGTVQALVKKYSFRGHLGDQDFYTLLGYEYPEFIQTLNCGFNRQLCTWWRDHGYSDVFNDYFKCDHKIVVLHGNCNTKIPR